MRDASIYRALMTIHFEAGGFAVAIVTFRGVPIVYLTCHESFSNDTAEKALRDVAFTVWEKVNIQGDIGISETFDVEFRGHLRLMTNKEWRELNTALSAPLCWGMVRIDEVLSVRKPIKWQIIVSNMVLIGLWFAGMAFFFYALDKIIDLLIGLIYG